MLDLRQLTLDLKELILGLRELILYEGTSSRSDSVSNAMYISSGLLACRIFQIVF